MPRSTPARRGLIAVAVLTLGPGAPAPLLIAQTVAHWDFAGGLGSTTGHPALTAAAAPPAGTPSVTFSTVVIRGAAAGVAHFTRGTYFRVHPRLAANGGGRYVNRFTLLMDVMFPDRSPSGGWASLFQTNTENANDGDWFIEPGGGVGINGSYRGSVPAGEWRRLVLVVDLTAGSFASFVDGVKVQEVLGQGLDGRFSLYSTADGNQEGFLLFADDDGECAEGYIDALQVRDVALCPEDVAAIGGIAAGPLPPEPISAHICASPPPPALEIKEGPYLQWATLSEVTVMWETNITAGGRLFYRRDGGGWTEAAEPGTRKIHEVRVGGFAPDEAVDYYVESRAAGDSVVSEVSSFRTNPAADDLPFNFVVWGDNQANPPVFTSLVQRMLPYSPELGVAVGDVVDAGNDYYRWGEELLTPLRPLAKSVPFYVAIGNHEANAHWFYDYLAQPGNEHWFSFDYAGCHFVIIDSNFPFGPGSEQYEWLRGDLFSAAAQEARWLFTFHHHPPYSEIYEEVIYARLRMHLVPLFETAGVDVNFTGHIHDYERGVYVPPDTGRRIAYVQTSGAGGRLWDDEFTGEYEQIQRVIQYVHHYCEIAIAGETLTLRAIDLQGRVIDSFTLTREPRNAGPPPPPPPPPPEGLAVTQWDFEAGDLTATFGPGTLEYLDRDGGATAAGTRFGSTASFGIPGIGGQAAQVMKFPRAASPGLGFRVEPGAPPNGGGSHVNDYTMVFDLCVPASSFKADSWLSFFNTNAENANDGELFLRLDTGGIGISGAYSGRILPNVWHRVATVFRSEGGEIVLHKFIDGAEVGSQALGPADGRWAIYTLEAETPWFLLFTDDNGETSSAYLSSLVFADRALSAAEVASLGGADADGILDGPCIGDCPPAFVRGDANADGAIDIGDALFILFAASGAAVVSDCPKSQDANDDGAVQVTDVVYLLNYLFLNGAVVKPPFPGCGADPTADALPCAAPGPCE